MFKTQTMKVNDVKLNVIIEGNGPAVILLHGFPDSAYLWRNQIRALVNAGYLVIAPDQRGFGDSDSPRGKEHYTTDKIVADVVALMDLLNIKRASVVGHDWGALIGWLLTFTHPHRLNRYIALSVGHPKAYASELGQKLRAWYAVAFQFPVIAEKMIKASNWFIMRKLTGNHPEMDKWIADLSRPNRLTAGLNWYRANFFHMFQSDFPRTKVPVFGIWSTGDNFLSEQQMKNSAAYVDASWRYKRIEGASHWIPLDAPEHLNRLILDYLKNKDT